MGGILGIMRLGDGEVTESDLFAMAAKAPDRFAESLEVWVDGAIGIGRSGSRAVARHAEAQLALVVDGHVHEWHGDRGIGTSAGEFECRVFQEFARRGRSSLESLIGDFTLALWDGANQSLLLARDAVGVRPLYLARGSHVVAFATDLRSLLAVDGVSSEIDESGVLHLFYPELLFVDRTSTSYREIQRVSQATHVVIERANRSSHQQHRYWSLDPGREIRLASDEEYGEAFRESFRTAVECRLPTDGPIGTTLSGGLDSASVTCMAREALGLVEGESVHAFSVGFPGFPDVDESEFQEAVVALGQIESHRIVADDVSPLVDFDEAIETIAEPFYGPNYYLPWGICRAARSAGVRVVLDGTDGDVTVGHGIDQLVSLAERARWSDFVAEARSITARYSHTSYATEDGILVAHGLPSLMRHARAGRMVSFFRGVQTLGLGFNRSRMGLLVGQGLGAFRRHRRVGVRRGAELNPRFAARLDLDDRFAAFDRARELEPGPRASHCRDLSSGALPSVLEHLDRIAAASGVEMRHPFADRRLIELCLAFPPEQKLRDGWGRWVLRQGMEDVLPESVRWRGDKAAMSPVYLLGLERYETERIRAVGGSQRVEPYIDCNTLKPAIDRFLSGDRRAQDGPLIWRAIVLDQWLRTRE